MANRVVPAEGYDPFQSWLIGQLDTYGWSNARLAREMDLFKGTIGRWLLSRDHYKFSRPSVDSYRRLGDLFGVDPLAIMRLAEVDGLDITNNLSPIKRDVMAAVIHIPDDVLVTVYPQLRALMDRHVQESIEHHVASATSTPKES